MVHMGDTFASTAYTKKCNTYFYIFVTVLAKRKELKVQSDSSLVTKLE